MPQGPLSSKYEILVDEVNAELCRFYRVPLLWKKVGRSRRYLVFNPQSSSSSGYFISFGEDAVELGVCLGASEAQFGSLKELLVQSPEVLQGVGTRLSKGYDELLLNYWSSNLDGASAHWRTKSLSQLRAQAHAALGIDLEGVGHDLTYRREEPIQFLFGISCRRRTSVESVVRTLKCFEPLFPALLQSSPIRWSQAS